MGEIHFPIREIHQIGKKTHEFLVHPDQCPVFHRSGIILAGISHARTGFRFVRPHPGQGQILLCFRGRGRVWLDGGWKKCTTGTAYLTPPGPPHAYEADGEWQIGWISYAPGWRGLALPSATLIETDPRPLEYILQGLHHETTADRDPRRLEHWGQLLHDRASCIVAANRSSQLWRLWQSVQSDPAAPWNLTSLARLARLGPEHLRRLNLRETGRSPMQHLTHLRMNVAASLLTTGHKVEDVATRVGYRNSFAFSTAFKRTMHQPPSRFRASRQFTNH